MHWLFEQLAVAFCLDGQSLEQPPQLFGSDLVSTQAPLHSMNGSTQAKSQLPETQVGVALAGGMHTVAQSPQCAVLLIKSTHEPPHGVVPPPHVLPQVPAVHTSPAPHAFVQEPQWAVSDAKSTQAPSHFA